MKLCHLTFIKPETNNFRFYQMYVTPGLFGDWALVREWGRVGSGGKVKSDWFDTEENALKAGLLIQRRKIKKGYSI